jgi:hypothetical protein
VGYNTNDGGYKKKILIGIQSLHKGSGKPTPWVYQRYVPLAMKISLLRPNSYAEAKSWDDLVYAFTGSLKDSSLDEFIHLMDRKIPGPQGLLPEYVRPVSYDNLDEVSKLLLSITPSTPRTVTAPAHQRRPRVEAATGVQPDGGHDGLGQQERIVIPRERVADGKEVEVVVSGGDHDIPQERVLDGKEAEAVSSSEDHEQEIAETRVSAAKTIQGAYRRHLEQKRTGAARKIQAAYRHHLEQKNVVHHYWYLLRKRSMQMEWSKGSRYHLLFRLPLAYILICLDVIKAFGESEKEAKKRVITAGDRDLEELIEALHQLRCDTVDCMLYEGSNQFPSELLKKTIVLQKKLSPSSDFHEGRSVTDLQHAVLDVKVIVESLENMPGSIGTRSQIKEHWKRGWMWIFEK